MIYSAKSRCPLKQQKWGHICDLCHVLADAGRAGQGRRSHDLLDWAPARPAKIYSKLQNQVYKIIDNVQFHILCKPSRLPMFMLTMRLPMGFDLCGSESHRSPSPTTPAPRRLATHSWSRQLGVSKASSEAHPLTRLAWPTALFKARPP